MKVGDMVRVKGPMQCYAVYASWPGLELMPEHRFRAEGSSGLPAGAFAQILVVHPHGDHRENIALIRCGSRDYIYALDGLELMPPEP